MLSKKFNIIYADNPWPYDNPQGQDPKRGGFKYPPMSIEALSALNVADICAQDCGLFLWATMPKLPEALQVMAAWGFTYTTTPFVWVKINPNAAIDWTDSSNMHTNREGDILYLDDIYSGLGYWTRGNVEIVLFGKRGRPEKIERQWQIVFAPRGRHSAKPGEVRDRIVALMGDKPRAELFARETAPGWTAIGNAIDGRSIEEVLT